MSTGGTFIHEPVMAGEVEAILAEVPPGTAVDATVGGGGHAARLLRSRPDLRLVAIDRDDVAVGAARRALAEFGGRVTVVHAAFDRLDEVLTTVFADREPGGRDGNGAHSQAATPVDPDLARVTAVLFDLGVSSPHLDHPERGFSYRFDAPLDMRMDRRQPTTAGDLVNESEPRELTRILREYGEERFARSITAAIVRRRPLAGTAQLADVVRDAIPARARRTGGHPAKRTFQALRIAVNDELGQLERGLDAAFARLAPGGRMVVLSYHSLEDRIVKRRFAEWSTGGSHPAGLPTLETARGGSARVLTKRPLRPSPEELANNPRAESVRLRALEKFRDDEGSAA